MVTIEKILVECGEKQLVRTCNTKNKHNTKDLAIKTSFRPKICKKLAENQEN